MPGGSRARAISMTAGSCWGVRILVTGLLLRSRSHCGEAAVDEQQRAGHIGRIVRCQEQDAGCDLFGRARAPEQGAPRGVFAVLLEGAAHLTDAALVEGRIDGP